MHALPLRSHSFCMTATLHPTALLARIVSAAPASSRRRPSLGARGGTAAVFSCTPAIAAGLCSGFLTQTPFDCSAHCPSHPAVTTQRPVVMTHSFGGTRRRPTLCCGAICVSGCLLGVLLLFCTIAAPLASISALPVHRRCPPARCSASPKPAASNPVAQPVAADLLYHHPHPKPSNASQQRCARASVA